MARSVVCWRIQGEDLVGTCHEPEGTSARIGLLLLNAGAAPRAGNSDLSVRLADRLARLGCPVFRFDMRGLGDSSGATPPDLDTYWAEVLSGRNDETTLALIRRLRREFGLARVVVGGLCATAVPALRAADCDASGVAGVLLLEPSFRDTARNAPNTLHGVALGRRRKRNALRRALSVQEWLYYFTGESSVALAARPMRKILLRVLKRSVGHALPKDANVPLVMRWHGSMSRGVRSLVVVADGEGTDLYVDRILESMPERHSSSVSCARIRSTNHLFTSGNGRDDVLEAVERWIVASFGDEMATRARGEGER